ncbi:hypothetical protein C8R45DRAFT_1107103 [Mycena sanguinolenta]|nr:hypothetical protein C8R45DRAFT_1107103 [Mycena sanguinolenta]
MSIRRHPTIVKEFQKSRRLCTGSGTLPGPDAACEQSEMFSLRKTTRTSGSNESKEELLTAPRKRYISASPFLSLQDVKSLTMACNVIIGPACIFLYTTLAMGNLIPADQISTDDFVGSRPIKGIVAIKAMAQISDSLMGNRYERQLYCGMSYNLYGDKLLGLNLFPASVYSKQTALYQTHASLISCKCLRRAAGHKTHTPTLLRYLHHLYRYLSYLPLMQMDCAVKDFIPDAQTKRPFPDLYDTVSGAWSVSKRVPSLVDVSHCSHHLGLCKCLHFSI